MKFSSRRTYAKFTPATRRGLHVSAQRDIGCPDDDDAERTTLRGALLDPNEAANYYSLPPDGGRLRTDAGGCSDRDRGKPNTFRILSETLTSGFAMERRISLAWTTALGIIDVAGSATTRRLCLSLNTSSLAPPRIVTLLSAGCRWEGRGRHQNCSPLPSIRPEV